MKGYAMAVVLGAVLAAGGTLGIWILAPMRYNSVGWGFFTGTILLFALLSGIAFIAVGIYLLSKKRREGKPR